MSESQADLWRAVLDGATDVVSAFGMPVRWAEDVGFEWQDEDDTWRSNPSFPLRRKAPEPANILDAANHMKEGRDVRRSRWSLRRVRRMGAYGCIADASGEGVSLDIRDLTATDWLVKRGDVWVSAKERWND